MKERPVVWHPCSRCDNDWPFPHPPQQREWLCNVCANASVAELQRSLTKAAAGWRQASSLLNQRNSTSLRMKQAYEGCAATLDKVLEDLCR